jgi:cytidyltransferase-like protein
VSTKKKKVVVAVSGGFDPVHVGHVRLFEEAKKLGDELVVILNNDNWLRKKKVHPFMPDYERKELIEALAAVDRVVLTKHPEDPTDMSVCEALLEVRPDIFANGGDRKPDANALPPAELAVCDEIGATMVYNIGTGGKVQSSSWLLSNYVKYAVEARLHEEGYLAKAESELKQKPRLS